MKRICIALCFVLFSTAICRADLGSIADSGSFSGPAQSRFLPLYYETTCTVVVSGTGSNFKIIPVSSSDGGRTYSTVTTIGGGSITSNGTYTGSVPVLPTALTNGFSLVQNTSMNGQVNYSVTCSAPPLSAEYGGVGSFSGPAPASGAKLVFSGDSITFGYGINNQTTNGCSGYTYPSPCFADQVTSHFTGTTEVNDGVPGTCLEQTTVVGSLCDSSQSLIVRYTTTMMPYAGNNSNWFFIMIGTNDIASATTRSDTQVNITTFRANLATIVNALISAGTPAGQIVLSEIPYGRPDTSNMGLLVGFNSAIADVALQYHTRFATTYRAMAICPALYNASTPGCMYDSAHPDNTGHANLATEMESANFINAVAARNDYTASGWPSNAAIGTVPMYAFHTTGTPSLFGNSGTYTTVNVATTSSSVGNISDWSTNNDATTGAQGRCLAVHAFNDNTHNDLSVDCGTDGTGDGNVGVYNHFFVGNHLNQKATCGFACKVTLVAGTATWTFGTAYSSSPVCTATAEGAPSGGAVIYTTISTTSVVVTSTNAADTRVVDVACFGYNK